MQAIMVNCECIIRQQDGAGAWRLAFLGNPENPARQAVERLNECMASDKSPNPADLLLVEGLPVLDEETAESPCVVIL